MWAEDLFFHGIYVHIHIHKRIVFKHYSIKPLAFGDQAKGGAPNRGGVKVEGQNGNAKRQAKCAKSGTGKLCLAIDGWFGPGPNRTECF